MREVHCMGETTARRPARPWRIIAEEASHEYDPVRMLALIRELNQALEEQGLLHANDTLTERKTA